MLHPLNTIYYSIRFRLCCISLHPRTQQCTVTHLINILKVKPGVEWSEGQVQVRELELCYTSTYVSLISIDTKSSKTQGVLLQCGQIHGDGVVLIENHCEGIRLNL